MLRLVHDPKAGCVDVCDVSMSVAEAELAVMCEGQSKEMAKKEARRDFGVGSKIDGETLKLCRACHGLV